MAHRPIRVEYVGDDGMILVAGTLDIDEARAHAQPVVADHLRTVNAMTQAEVDDYTPRILRSGDPQWWRWVPTGPHDWSGEGYKRMLMLAEPHARGAFPGVTFG